MYAVEKRTTAIARRPSVARGRPMGGIWDDIVNAVAPPAKQVVDEVTTGVKESVTSSGSKVVDELLRSSQFKVVLDQVQAAAEQGVVDKVKENAPYLMAVAAVCGGIGGVVFRGPLGIVGAGVVGTVAAFKLIGNVAPKASGSNPRRA